MTICTIHLCEMKNRVIFIYKGTIILGFLIVLLNDKLCYDTEITGDVVGFLTEAEVTTYLMQIESLSKRL